MKDYKKSEEYGNECMNYECEFNQLGICWSKCPCLAKFARNT